MPALQSGPRIGCPPPFQVHVLSSGLGWGVLLAWACCSHDYLAQFGTVKSWWDELLSNNTQPVKALSSLLLLVGWELWKERNARVFRSKAAPVAIVTRIMKEEMSIWAIAGAKNLSNVMPRE